MTAILIAFKLLFKKTFALLFKKTVVRFSGHCKQNNDKNAQLLVPICADLGSLLYNDMLYINVFRKHLIMFRRTILKGKCTLL